MKKSIALTSICMLALCGCSFFAYEKPRYIKGLDPLADFWHENDGLTVRRLPVNVVPENVFWSFGTRDFSDNMKTFNRLVDEGLAKGSYNCITLTLRCNPELGDTETIAAAKACCARAHRQGVKVYMDTDPRIARTEFFSKFPGEKQSIAIVASAQPTNGIAGFATGFYPVQDHMSWGSKNAYRPLNGRVASSFAVKRRADGSLDFASRRPVKVEANIKVNEWQGDRSGAKGGMTNPKDGYTKFSEVLITGCAEGLDNDETLVVVSTAEYYSIDIFSPNLLPFIRKLMRRYKAIGADGGMRDEWGNIPNYDPNLKTFFYSPYFAEAYRKDFKRDLLADLPLMALGAKGDSNRSAAVGAYMKTTLKRNVEIERDFYETDKRLFGYDVYVCKHPTWYSSICPQEFFHNGLDWWQVPRDWAQSDETTPIYAINALAKKWGGPVWMNEGYTATPEENVYRVWTYALCGGRQVYHGLYSGNAKAMAKYNAMPWEERRIRTSLDLLSVDNLTAQTRIRLLNLITRAHVDVPLAYVFGHEELVDFSGKGYNDHARNKLLEVFMRGYWADAYPASEFALGTFWIDNGGYLCVGRQRYNAMVTRHLRANEKAALAKLIKEKGKGKAIKTKFFDDIDANAICAYLDEIKATRQPPFKPATKAGPFVPEPNGTTRLLDGTTVRISADWDHPRGLAINETLVSRGVNVACSAEGVAAVRASKKGEIVAFAAGGLKSVDGPGLKIKLDRPEDVALMKIDGEWHGVWQTAHPENPVPAPLKAICNHWIKLQLPGHLGK